ncbi:MAG: hypothetical protein KGI53_04670 [Nitrospirota bacterium]|nr:hypothetical protein [Nitrospirota bacterium]
MSAHLSQDPKWPNLLGWTKKPNADSVAIRNNDKLIEHLTKEIVTQSEYITTFRSRLAFAVLIGPFIILSTFVVATKDSLHLGVIDCSVTLALIITGFCYILIGLLSALLDSHVTDQCNKWRHEIIRLANGGDPEENSFLFKHELLPFYAAYFFLVLIAFSALCYIYWHLTSYASVITCKLPPI